MSLSLDLYRLVLVVRFDFTFIVSACTTFAPATILLQRINANVKRNPNPYPNPNLNPHLTPNQEPSHYPHSNSFLSEISSEEKLPPYWNTIIIWCTCNCSVLLILLHTLAGVSCGDNMRTGPVLFRRADGRLLPEHYLLFARKLPF